MGCTLKADGEVAPAGETPPREVNLAAPPDFPEDLKEKLVGEVMGALLPPEGAEYTKINITATERGGVYLVEVVAAGDFSPRVDVYRFVYDQGEGAVVLEGYLLEAIPGEVRSRVISIALADGEVQRLLTSPGFAPGEPTVRRILPETAAEFYAPVTLFSVTWVDFQRGRAYSVLVDPASSRVVERWLGERSEGREAHGPG
ncbi:MAG: hypothetical protein GXO66_07485 [Euryarchaeota archaeon]|nr:hypothetical protein [Euryarchaeota archaeon]